MLLCLIIYISSLASKSKSSLRLDDEESEDSEVGEETSCSFGKVKKSCQSGGSKCCWWPNQICGWQNGENTCCTICLWFKI